MKANAAEIRRAEALKRAAEEYAETRPDAWEWLVLAVRESAEQGYHVSVNALAYEMRDCGYGLKSDLASALGRLMKARFPELAPYIVTKFCALDLVDWGADDGEE